MDISNIAIPKEIEGLVEQIAENVHDTWANSRLAEGWVYGKERDDVKKTHPCLVPYRDLTESEREYDRNTSLTVLKSLIKLGYVLTKVSR